MNKNPEVVPGPGPWLGHRREEAAERTRRKGAPGAFELN
jgi:hypothetical protein